MVSIQVRVFLTKIFLTIRQEQAKELNNDTSIVPQKGSKLFGPAEPLWLGRFFWLFLGSCLCLTLRLCLRSLGPPLRFLSVLLDLGVELPAQQSGVEFGASGIKLVKLAYLILPSRATASMALGQWETPVQLF